MPFVKHTDEMRECALRLWELGWDTQLIVESLSVSERSLYRWCNNFFEFGTVSRPLHLCKIQGHPCIIVQAVMTAIKEVYQNEADIYLDELVFWVAIHHDIAISCSALQRTLEDVGLTRKLLHKIARERDEFLIAEFNLIRHQLSHGTGEEFVCLDKVSKNDHDAMRCYGRAMTGQHADFIANFCRGTRYSTCAAIMVDGYIAVRVIEGSYNTEEFLDFVTEEVVSLLPCSCTGYHTFCSCPTWSHSRVPIVFWFSTTAGSIITRLLLT